MATYKVVQESTLPSIASLECDICGSSDIIENPEGYVCRDCAVVLEIQKLQYDRPYNEDLIQYAKGVGKTQIGTRRERISSPLSIKLQRINKYNSITTSEEAVVEKSRIETSRIFESLDLSEYSTVKEMVSRKFKEIRPQIRSGSKYRNVEKLTAVTIYFCLKLSNVPINPYELIEVSKITKKEFNDFNLQLQRFLPEYGERNRHKYILQRILEVSEHFGLGVPFYLLSKKILFRLWQGIKSTTDNVVAGLVSSIAVLCTCKEKVSISMVCTRLGIRMSTIQYQVKKNIFGCFGVEGFTTLIKSSDILVKIIEKLGLLQAKESALEEVQEVVVSDDHVELVLGNAAKIFNFHDNVDYYFLAVRGENAIPLIVAFQINGNPLNDVDKKKSLYYNRELMNFQIHRYYKAKDPPSIAP